MTTDTQNEAAEAASDAVTVADTEGEHAKELLAKARYDAFRMVTDGRKEAESILDLARDEAARILAAAHETAASVAASAETEAEELESSAEESTAEASATETTVAELEEEHHQLTERVGSLRVLADQLEERFAALATRAQTSSPQNEDSQQASADQPTEQLAKPILDYSPAVAPPPKASDISEEDDEEPVERGSFYSRRSAKLPSIGNAGGKSALDMMRAIRETSDEN